MPNKKIFQFFLNKNKSLLLIVILLFLLVHMCYQNILRIDNIAYAEETIIPILTYHNFTKVKVIVIRLILKISKNKWVI